AVLRDCRTESCSSTSPCNLDPTSRSRLASANVTNSQGIHAAALRLMRSAGTDELTINPAFSASIQAYATRGSWRQRPWLFAVLFTQSRQLRALLARQAGSALRAIGPGSRYPGPE